MTRENALVSASHDFSAFYRVARGADVYAHHEAIIAEVVFWLYKRIFLPNFSRNENQIDFMDSRLS
jgi:hypothetical protein